MKIQRSKKPKRTFAIIYKLSKITPVNKRKKLSFFLNMNWYFWRLASEIGEEIYPAELTNVKEKSLSFILEKLNKNHIVLDLGCKYGNKSFLFSKKAKKVVGIDYDNTAIEIAKNHFSAENLKFITADALEYIKIKEEKFNVVILSHILEHVENVKLFLNSIASNTKFIYIEVPDFECNLLNQYRLKEKLDIIYTDDDHVHEFNRDEIMSLFRELNIEIIESQYRFGVQQYWVRTNK